MKNKIFIPLGVVTSLSIGTAFGLSGCSDSAVTGSAKHIVDFHNNILDSYFDLLKTTIGSGDSDSNKSSPDTAEADNKGTEASTGDRASTGEKSGGDTDKSNTSNNTSDNNNLGNNIPAVSSASAAPVNYAPYVYYENVITEEPVYYTPVRVADAAPSSNPVVKTSAGNNTKAVDTKNPSSVKSDNKNNIITPVKDSNEKEIKTPVKDNNDDTENEIITPDDSEEITVIIEPDDPDIEEEIVIPPVEDDDFEDSEEEHVHSWIPYNDSIDEEHVASRQSVFKEVIDNSKITSFSDSNGAGVCDVTFFGTIDTFEDGELVSSDGEEQAGTIEIHNLLTDETLTLEQGEIDDLYSYVQGMFEQEIFMDGRTFGPSFSTFIEILDNNEYAYYSDFLGDPICEVHIYNTIDRYENDVLVSSDCEAEVGTIEIHNLLTDEIQVFAPGTLDDYESYVVDMFDGKAYFAGALIGPAYAYPEGEEDAEYSSDDGYSAPGDSSELTYICEICGEVYAES